MTERGHLEIELLADQAAIIWVTPCGACGGHRVMVWSGDADAARRRAAQWADILGLALLDPERLN
ncbi:hypothetical protein ABIB82_004052 [Bradyrhizobium sp. i1.8.4]|uniref:hypothetical protein n=1 Tax=unclassified Bradyrhizobium TaxID=2631580 RepID=UPI003D240F28